MLIVLTKPLGKLTNQVWNTTLIPLNLNACATTSKKMGTNESIWKENLCKYK